MTPAQAVPSPTKAQPLRANCWQQGPSTVLDTMRGQTRSKVKPWGPIRRWGRNKPNTIYIQDLPRRETRGKTRDKHTYSIAQAGSKCPGLGLNVDPEPMGSRVHGPGSQVSPLRAIKAY